MEGSPEWELSRRNLGCSSTRFGITEILCYLLFHAGKIKKQSAFQIRIKNK